MPAWSAKRPRAGDKLAMNAFRRAGQYLGLGITNLLHLFNPRMVVLGGSVTKAGPLLFDPMWEAIRATSDARLPGGALHRPRRPGR